MENVVPRIRVGPAPLDALQSQVDPEEYPLGLGCQLVDQEAAHIGMIVSVVDESGSIVKSGSSAAL